MNTLQEQEEQQPRTHDKTQHISSMSSGKSPLLSSSRPCADSNVLTSSITHLDDCSDTGSDIATDVNTNAALFCTSSSESVKHLAGEEDTRGRIQISTLVAKE